MVKKIGIITSGGDAPGMNAAIRAIVKASVYHDIEVVGVTGGYQGLIEDNLEPLTDIHTENIADKGGTILKTSRSMAFMDQAGRDKAVAILKKHGIEHLVVIGGEGSLKGADKLHELGIHVIGIPGTIDNDLGYTDYSIGFDTTLNTVLSAIRRIKDTGYSHNKTTIVEVMGRHCGDLALYTALSGEGNIISTPEQTLRTADICVRLKKRMEAGKGDSLIVVTENIYDLDKLKQEIAEELKIEVRTTVLGFIQRGGEPSAFDRILANKMGIKAVQLLLNGNSGLAVGIKQNEIITKELHTIHDVQVDKQELYQLVNMLID